MPAYIVSYDLKKPGQDYKDLIAELKTSLPGDTAATQSTRGRSVRRLGSCRPLVGRRFQRVESREGVRQARKVVRAGRVKQPLRTETG